MRFLSFSARTIFLKSEGKGDFGEFVERKSFVELPSQAPSHRVTESNSIVCHYVVGTICILKVCANTVCR